MYRCTKCTSTAAGQQKSPFRRGYSYEKIIGILKSEESRPQAAGDQKGVKVSYRAETPFDCIEGSHEYLALLAESLEEARRDVEAEVALADREQEDRRKEALLLVSFNLAKLE